MVGPLCLSHNSQTTPTPSVKSVVDMWARGVAKNFPFPSSEIPLIKNQTPPTAKKKKNTPKLSLFYNAPAKPTVTFKIYISRNKSCLK